MNFRLLRNRNTIADSVLTQNSSQEMKRKSVFRKFFIFINMKFKIVVAINCAIILFSVVGMFFSYRTLRILTEHEPEEAFDIVYDCQEKRMERSIRYYRGHWIVENYYFGKSTAEISCGLAVTFATQARDFRFFRYLMYLMSTWRSPISIAIYTTAADINITISSIEYIRNCWTYSELVVEYISFHIVIPHDQLPVHLPSEHHTSQIVCSDDPLYLTKEPIERKSYPINMMRNIARRAANTRLYIVGDLNHIIHAAFINSYLVSIINNLCDEVSNTRGGLRCRTWDGDQALIRSLHIIPIHYFNTRSIAFLLNPHFISEEILQQGLAKVLKLLYDLDMKGTPTKYEHIFLADVSFPYFDERFDWDPEQQYQKVYLYAMCLVGITKFRLPREASVLFFKTGLNHYNDPLQAHQIYARSLNQTNLRIEYTQIFGIQFAEHCEACLRNGTDCI